MNILTGVRPDKLILAVLANRISLGLACTVAIVVHLLAGPASALVKFDFEQRYFAEPPLNVMDHCVVESNGTYHLFYLRGDPAVDIGHATTTDFVHWNLEDPVLEPGTWGDVVLWAPHVLKGPSGTWYMFYTGPNAVGAQQTGLAISSNLFDWTTLPWPVYHPDPSWAQWDETLWCHGRDPHVLEQGDKFYMFLTAKSNEGFGAVACAQSDYLIDWEDIGPMYVHDSWHVLESVFVMQRNNRFHMFFTEETVNGTSHMSSDSLFSGWNIADRRIIDLGHAPQVTTLPDGTEMFSRHTVYNNGFGIVFHVIGFDTLAWVGDIPAPYKPWALSGNWSLIWGNAFAYQPVFANNPAARGEDVADTYEGYCWLGTYERYTGPLGFGTPGGFQGDSRTGVIQSKRFTVTGKSMSLLVGGGNNIDLLYVALVDASNDQIIYKETGRNTDEMDRRYWDLVPFLGRNVYVEIADLSTGTFGHINCDDIAESMDIVESGSQVITNDKKSKKNPLDLVGRSRSPGRTGEPTLGQNVPNPFNPSTSISYQVPTRGHVSLRVYDVGGRLIRSLVDDIQPAGAHTASWNGLDDVGRRAVSGVYLYRLVFEGVVVDTRKMLMLK
jgi:predicted GH43/DUF377 family glycosyl hydrolase